MEADNRESQTVVNLKDLSVSPVRLPFRHSGGAKSLRQRLLLSYCCLGAYTMSLSARYANK